MRTRERERVGEVVMERLWGEERSTFEATAYLAPGFDKAWQGEVLLRGV